jgi:ATP phosphoribosyltransferase
MKGRLTLALPKGRLLEPALDLLRDLGVAGVDQDSRRLIFDDVNRGLRLLFLKPADVPAYVTYGAADLGIVGRDILLEQEPDVYEPLDLGFGFCRLVVAEPRELWERDDPAKWSWVRVATKYPRLTEQYFSERGVQVELVRLDGSIELAPLVGLADRIVDLVQSGETLRANGLVEVAEITRSTARLIVNRASMKTEFAAVTRLVDDLRARVLATPAAAGRPAPAVAAKGGPR